MRFGAGHLLALGAGFVGVVLARRAMARPASSSTGGGGGGGGGGKTTNATGKIVSVYKLAHQPRPAQTSVPGAVLAIPPKLRDPFTTLVHMRGYGTTAEAIARRLAPLVERFPGFVLVVPEFTPYTKSEAENDPGTFAHAGGFSAFLAEVFADGGVRASLSGARRSSAIVLSAHSGGYRAAAAVLADGKRPPASACALLDALYGQVQAFEGYARGGGRLIDVFRDDGGSPGVNSRALAKALGTTISSADAPGAFSSRLAFRATTTPHPSVDVTYLPRILAALSSSG